MRVPAYFVGQLRVVERDPLFNNFFVWASSAQWLVGGWFNDVGRFLNRFGVSLDATIGCLDLNLTAS